MRNHSSTRSLLRRIMTVCVTGAAVLAFCELELHAQCSTDDDPDSYGCQSQQAEPLYNSIAIIAVCADHAGYSATEIAKGRSLL